MKRQLKLTRYEKQIENALVQGEYVDIQGKELEEIAEAISRRKKDTVLNIRINSQDLKSIKEKAKKFGIGYQTLISEFLHKVAHA
jgi:predicted DNA binding CopG/RHH family protein